MPGFALNSRALVPAHVLRSTVLHWPREQVGAPKARRTIMPDTKLQDLCVNTIRFLSIDAVQKAKSGHPGMPLGAAPMAYVLWMHHLKHSPADPHWIDRDRFVLSAGHGSMLLYSLLHLTGYDVTMDDIMAFRQWGSKTPGHPEHFLTPGVESTTGPLGQGFGNAVGMAMAEAHLAARYNRPGFSVIDHFTYVIASDGDFMEGVAAEAASLAGHLHLGKLICLYDSNGVSLGQSTDLEMSEDVSARFKALGWHTQAVDDGTDIEGIDRAIAAARGQAQNPSLIIVKTHIGYGSPWQDTFKAHGAPLGDHNVAQTKRNLHWPTEPSFHVPAEALQHFRTSLDRGRTARLEWDARFAEYKKKWPAEASELARAYKGDLEPHWDKEIPRFGADPKGQKTRAALGIVMNATAAGIPALVGGSGDLDPSTNTALKDKGDFEFPDRSDVDRQGSAGGSWGYEGRNIHYGVREHAMGAITNGLALHGGLLPFAATFLIFSDYMRPAIRLAALMRLHVIYCFTHDSIGLGEDGPTHQPIEHLASLRAIPNLLVIRPCDANETAEAWRVAVETKGGPVALILTRQDVPTLDRSKFAAAENLRKGAYVLAHAEGDPEITLIATGSEVHLATEACEVLRAGDIAARVVSMPCWELFEEQTREYKESVLPPAGLRLSIEAAATLGWSRYASPANAVIGLDRFGASAPGETNMENFGFTVDHVVAASLELLQRSFGKTRAHARSSHA